MRDVPPSGVVEQCVRNLEGVERLAQREYLVLDSQELRLDGVDPPGSGHAFEVMFATIGERLP